MSVMSVATRVDFCLALLFIICPRAACWLNQLLRHLSPRLIRKKTTDIGKMADDGTTLLIMRSIVSPGDFSSVLLAKRDDDDEVLQNRSNQAASQRVCELQRGADALKVPQLSRPS